MLKLVRSGRVYVGVLALLVLVGLYLAVRAPSAGASEGGPSLTAGEEEVCPGSTTFQCDTNGDGINDACYVCDANGDGTNDSCYLCDNNSDGVNDTCYQCDTNGDGKNDACKTWKYCTSYAQLVACGIPQIRQMTPPAPNGCGGATGPSSWVPNDPAPGSGNSFLACCNAHDNGYSNCSIPKSTTDNAFHTCMTAACISSWTTGGSNWLQYQACLTASDTYYNAVDSIGASFYQAAQLASCQCKKC